nr:MAG TPA: hypothetical protein [Caudoviricetes sp.]
MLHGPSGEARFLNGRPWKSPRAKFFLPLNTNKKAAKRCNTNEMRRIAFKKRKYTIFVIGATTWTF